MLMCVRLSFIDISTRNFAIGGNKLMKINLQNKIRARIIFWKSGGFFQKIGERKNENTNQKFGRLNAKKTVDDGRH